MAFDGYIRVSRVGKRKGPSFQSPDEQRQRIEGWAQSHGKTIGEWYTDLDVSGGTLSRPGLDAVMERIKSGKSEGIVVARLNRLSRAGVADALKLCQEVYDAGGLVVAIDVGIDPTTPVGKFARTLMLALAEMELERAKESWSAARERAVERGAFIGPTPLGFDKQEDGSLTPNEHDAPLVLDAFEISGNDGMRPAIAFLKATWPDRFWTRTTARRFFANRVYLGEVRHGEFVLKDAHEAIVDQTTWDFAQHPELAWTRQPDGKYPLSGIASCAACGGPLRGQTTGRPGKPRRRYHCVGPGCTERPHVGADALETYALDTIRSSDVAHGHSLDAEAIFQYSKAIIAASHELERFVSDTEAATLVSPEVWREGIRSRQAALEQAQQDYDDARENSRELPDLEDPTPEDQRTIFDRLIDSLVVERAPARADVEARSKLALVN